MKSIKFILPALTEAKSPYFRPIKYSLFPPLGLATLAGYVPEDWEISIHDEHVENLDISDNPDLVVIQVYITNAYRAYAIADQYRERGVYVCLGGLHVTTLPEEAAEHADTIFIGPGEDTWPQFLDDYRTWYPKKIYRSYHRSLIGIPRVRRELIKRNLYLVPNSIVVSRGCPHHCEFCYKDSFFLGGKSYYTNSVDSVLAEIDSLPGRHLYFLDDHLFANPRFASELFDNMKGMGRLWQAAGTVQSMVRPGLLEKAVASGLRSLFIGFETLNTNNLLSQKKYHNVTLMDNSNLYEQVIQRLHDHGVMINASFVFGMDDDDDTVFDRTVEWAVEQGIETATFHILTPYPGTRLYQRLTDQRRILTHNWDLYDTRHGVFQPTNMSTEILEAGYWRAYKDFYKWGSIFKSVKANPHWKKSLRHLAYTCGWKKFEPFWDWVIKARKVSNFIPILEAVLTGKNNQPAIPAQDKILSPEQSILNGILEN